MCLGLYHRPILDPLYALCYLTTGAAWLRLSCHKCNCVSYLVAWPLWHHGMVASPLLCGLRWTHDHGSDRQNDPHSRGPRDHGRELRDHRHGLRDHVRELRDHGRELRDHVRELRDHVRELRDHVRELRDHGRELRDHARELRDHGPELRGHGRRRAAGRSGGRWRGAG